MSLPLRRVPILDELNRGFWTAGRESATASAVPTVRLLGAPAPSHLSEVLATGSAVGGHERKGDALHATPSTARPGIPTWPCPT